MKFLSIFPLGFVLTVSALLLQGSDVYYAIKEELSPGTIFGYIAEDSDLRRKVGPDEMNNLAYTFLTQGNPNSQYFSIDLKTGVLSVAKRIDRETACSFRTECQLTVSAVVQSELGPFFHIINVHVEIIDINDNPPTFSLTTFQVIIPENAALGVSFPLPTAFDKDTGTNNSVRDYFLVSGHPTFALQTSEDELGAVQSSLELLRELNREETPAMTVLVGARDGGKPPLTGTLTVEVEVSDVNDNYPVFESYVYYVNVSETTRTNDPLVQVKATDADIGPNGNLTYTFSKLQPMDVLELFRMDKITGVMYLSRSVEDHTGKVYELVIEASDQGSPPKVSRALVRVRVLDTVNSRPEIYVDILSSTDGQAAVSEYAEVGKVVAYVSVRDPDSGENGVTVCRLNTRDFELQPLNNQGQYKVILVTNLDREKVARYDIAVGCTDYGFPPLENTAKFIVHVRDENDNAPVFSQRNYITTILENQTVGAVITQLLVTDLDEGRNSEVFFRVAGAYSSDFSILDNGTMIATSSLDREVSEKLVVKVLAIDRGFPPLSGSATVFITLEDVNDQAPSFNDRRYSFNVAEDARPGAYVGIVTAEDDDLGRNAEITFMAASVNDDTSAAFVITRDGVVKTNMKLDREQTDVHYFAIIAKDGGDLPLSTTTTVTIHVDDVNDNTPYFVYPTATNDTLSIPHTFPLRTPILRAHAYDLDAGKNSALIFSCASANDSGLFGMDSITGDLFLHRYLSRTQTGLYVLRIAAHDEGMPQLSNQTLLYLDIYFDNSTLLDPAPALIPSKVVVTTLIVVGVLLIVAGVTVIAIFCIRRKGRKKKQTANGILQHSPPNKLQGTGGYYIAPGVCESPAFGSGLSSSGGMGKPLLEQRAGSDTTEDTSNMRTANPYVIMPPHSNYSDAEGPPEIIEISRSGKYLRVDDTYPEDLNHFADDSHFSTFRSQDGAFSPSFRQNSYRRQSEDTMDEAKPADDTLSLSELSYQSTSDSGRGGSEFDVNNAGSNRGAAREPTPSSFKGGTTLRPRDHDVTFTTFRGESPSSFRFDSDSDTLTRNHRHASARTSPLPLTSGYHGHARSMNCVAGAPFPSHAVSRSQPFSADSEDANSTSGRNSAARRALTPSFSFSHHGCAAESPQFLPSTPGGRYGGGSIGRNLGAHSPGPVHPNHLPMTTLHSGGVPSVEFRGRNIFNFGTTGSNRRGAADYANAYSDHESGDDTRGGPEHSEDSVMLPPYPEELEEEGEYVDGPEISEHSALNFVPGLTSLSRDNTFQFSLEGRQSEV